LVFDKELINIFVNIDNNNDYIDGIEYFGYEIEVNGDNIIDSDNTILT